MKFFAKTKRVNNRNKSKSIGFQTILRNAVKAINLRSNRAIDLIKKLIQFLDLPLRVTLYASTLISISSLVGILFSTFLIFSNSIFLSEQTLNQYYDNQEMRHFNPVLKFNSNTEEVISKLLFLPLYAVDSDNNITTKLLESKPKWNNIQPNLKQKMYTEIQFTIKKDAFWSNNQPITTEDVKYTFERLKEESGNPEFYNIMIPLEISVIDNKSFVILSSDSNPELIYQLGFNLIPKDYFNNQNNIGLLTEPRSFFPQVTSGEYFLPNQISIEGLKINMQNPQTNSMNQRVNFIQLQTKTPSINKKYSKINFIHREYTDNQNTLSDNSFVIIDSLISDFDKSIKQDNFVEKLVPNNIVHGLFLNSFEGQGNYLVNQKLRMYIICSYNIWKKNQQVNLSTYKTNPLLDSSIAKNFCSDEQFKLDNELTSYTKNNANIYNILFDETRSIKKVLLYNNPITLNIKSNLNTSNSTTLLLRNFLLDIGLQSLEPIDIQNEVITENLTLLEFDFTKNNLFNLIDPNKSNYLSILSNKREEIQKFNPKEVYYLYYSDESNTELLNDKFSQLIYSNYLYQTLQQQQTKITVSSTLAEKFENYKIHSNTLYVEFLLNLNL
jgi:hypothetical protein